MTLLRLAIKNITSKPGRFLLTSAAIVVGVALTSAVFIMTDAWRDSFADLSQDVESGYDLSVRVELLFGDRATQAPSVPTDLLTTVSSTPGVAWTQARVGGFPVIVNKPDGTANTVSTGAPNLGFNWPAESQAPNVFIREGAVPTGDEFAVDVDSFDADGLTVGERYDIQTIAGVREMQLVGTFTFADPEENASLLGAKLVAVDTPTALELFKLGAGYDDIILAVEAGTSAESVAADLAAALPDGFEVVTREVVAAEFDETFTEVIDIFRTVLLVFAFIILLVAAFIIYNVFSIIVSQRVQEIGLLRALGATGRQITRSIALEALVVGLFATVTGVLAGIPIAYGIQKLLQAADFGSPDIAVPLRALTIVVAAVLGLGITLASAIWPALKARSVSPMSALRNDSLALRREPTRNPLLGRLLTAAGVGLVVLAIAANAWQAVLILPVFAAIALYAGLSRIRPTVARFSLVALAAVLLAVALSADLKTSVLLSLLGAAALIAFIGTNIMAPLFAGPVARAIGRPIAAVGGVPSKMARENAGRVPERTATAASALMIGLALVTAVSVVASSVKSTFADVLREAVSSDWVVAGEQQGPAPATFSSDVAEALAALPEVESVLPIQWGFETIRTPVDGDTHNPYATDLAEIERHFDIEQIEFDETLLGPDAAILHEDVVDDYGVGLGDTLTIEFANGVDTDITVAGVYGDLAIFDSGWILDPRVYDAANTGSTSIVAPGDSSVSLLIADGVSEDDARTAIEGAIATHPQLEAKTKQEFQDDIVSSINTVLNIVNALLGMSVALALLGIAITLALSVFERTREIGLLRAVGATRKQMKRTIRVEGIIVALFGLVLGVGLGLLFGVAAVQLIPDDFVSNLSIPSGTLVGAAIVAVLAGVIAAYFPARRAAKLNVLDAISHGE